MAREFLLGLDGLARQGIGLGARLAGSTDGLGSRGTRGDGSVALRGGPVEARAKFLHRLQRAGMLTLGRTQLGLQAFDGHRVGLLQRLLAIDALALQPLLMLAALARLRLHAGQRLGAGLGLRRGLPLALATRLGGATRLLLLPLLAQPLAIGASLHQAITPRRQLEAEPSHARGIDSLGRHLVGALLQQAVERGVHHLAPTAPVELELEGRRAEALRERLEPADRVVLVPSQDLAKLGRRVAGQARSRHEFTHREHAGVLEGIKLPPRAKAAGFPPLKVGFKTHGGT